MTILQVAIKLQPIGNEPISLDIARCVPLGGIVTIVLRGGVCGRKFQTRHLAIVNTIVERRRHAHRERQTLCGVVCRRHQTSKIVQHHLLADQIGTRNRRAIDHNRRQTILCKFLIVLVVAVVTVAIGVVCRSVQLPLVVDNMIENQLIIHLRIVIGMVVIETDNRILVRAVSQRSVTPNLALGIVATILLHLIGRKTRIGQVDLCLATKREQLNHRATIVVARLEHIRCQIARRAIDITVRRHVRQTTLDSPMTAQQSRRQRQLLLCGVERAIRHRRTSCKLGRDRCRSHIERCSEGTRTRSRRSHTALQLQRADRRDQIGRIVPIDRMSLGIVHRYTIECHVDTRRIATTHTERGGTDTRTALRRDHHRRHIGQNRGDILAIVSALDLLTRVGREGNRLIVLGAHAIDLDLLNGVERVLREAGIRLVLRLLRGVSLRGCRGYSPDGCGIERHCG